MPLSLSQGHLTIVCIETPLRAKRGMRIRRLFVAINPREVLIYS